MGEVLVIARGTRIYIRKEERGYRDHLRERGEGREGREEKREGKRKFFFIGMNEVSMGRKVKGGWVRAGGFFRGIVRVG